MKDAIKKIKVITKRKDNIPDNIQLVPLSNNLLFNIVTANKNMSSRNKKFINY